MFLNLNGRKSSELNPEGSRNSVIKLKKKRGLE